MLKNQKGTKCVLYMTNIYKGNFFQYCHFYFYYPKYENVFQTLLVCPKRRKVFSIRIYCKQKSKNNLQFFS